MSCRKQEGGQAPVNFHYGANMQQPSRAVMDWATTAGMKTPSAAEMRGVAHGGKRRTRRKLKRRSTKRVHKRKTHYKKRK